MIHDYDGTDVHDSSGDTLGTVYRTYDDAEGQVRYVLVDLGGEGKRLVPADNAEWGDGMVRVPWSRQVVARSPDASPAGDTLEGELLAEVRSFYTGGARQDEPASIPVGRTEPSQVDSELAQAGDEGSASNQRIGAARDQGDYLEIPIVEEVMVKKPVVKEVLRVRKRQVVDQETVEGDVRREDVEVIGPEGNQTAT